jgi:cyclic peptide transporter
MDFLSISTAGISTFFIVILYLMAPVNSLITALPFITRIRIALKRIEDFTTEVGNYPSENATEVSAPVEFESVSFSDVVYQYKENSGSGFTLGPVDLKINKGEVLFITGENGSGKSTFLMLLSGLLRPSSGQVLYNGKPIGDDKYADYRNGISAVFVDNFLFSENYNGFDLSDSNRQWHEGLILLQLQQSIIGRGQKPQRLSKGQQKRLALIYALMENKDVLVLDEWAAEQDPVFRAVFYREILPKLKKQGKTIIAITHDDKYFSAADRVIKFNKGHIVSEEEMPLTNLIWDSN